MSASRADRPQLRQGEIVPAAAAMPIDALIRHYLRAKHEVVQAGYIDEIVWQHRVQLVDLDHVTLMREAAWVVLCSGMREQVIRNRFGALGAALHEWNPHAIADDRSAAERALPLFRHQRKIDAIASIAMTLSSLPAEEIRAQIRDDCESFLTRLPYVGPVTWAHLAKNIGMPVVKADRHLVRLSRALRQPSVAGLCATIGSWLGEPLPVVDVVLWRYSVLHVQACSLRSCDGTPHALSWRVEADR